MTDPDFLYTVAQVGVTYAGFSTLVTVVAYQREKRTLPARIYYMLLLSIIVVAFALFPVIVSAFEVSEPIAWRLSSGLFGAVWGAYWINAIFTLRQRFPVWGALSFLNKANTVLFHPASALALLLGALGAWGDYTEEVYVSALFVMLYMSAYLFLQIIVGLIDENRAS